MILQKQFSDLTDEQREVVCQFLAYLLENDDEHLEFLIKSIRLSLDNYWLKTS